MLELEYQFAANRAINGCKDRVLVVRMNILSQPIAVRALAVSNELMSFQSEQVLPVWTHPKDRV
jgi:hypothetical protein